MRKVTILYSSDKELTAFNEVVRFIRKGCTPDIEFVTKRLIMGRRSETWESAVSFDGIRTSDYVLELGLHKDCVLVKCHKQRYDHASEFML